MYRNHPVFETPEIRYQRGVVLLGLTSGWSLQMKMVVPRGELYRYSACCVESSFFGQFEVRSALSRSRELPGLSDLIQDCGCTVSNYRTEIHNARIFTQIALGHWWVITEHPFSPLTEDELQKNSRFPFDRVKAEFFENIFKRSLLSKGPGKWVLHRIEYSTARNAFMVMANRIGTLSEEGRVIGADGRDLANTARTMIHQWTPLAGNEQHLASRSVVRRYGEMRGVKQLYYENEENWQTSGVSFHWQPVTADVEFELREEGNDR
jgi:hypothetical protein